MVARTASVEVGVAQHHIKTGRIADLVLIVECPIHAAGMRGSSEARNTSPNRNPLA